jgi:hypothetical protein
LFKFFFFMFSNCFDILMSKIIFKNKKKKFLIYFRVKSNLYLINLIDSINSYLIHLTSIKP